MEKKNEKLKVKYLATVYKRQANETQKNRWLAENVKLDRTYLPLGEKLDLIDRIINSCMHDNDGSIKVNTSARYLLRTMKLIDIYLNIDIDFDNIVSEYDSLSECGVIGKLLDMVPANECVEFDTFMKMSVDDFMTNYYENHAFISSQVDRFAKLFGAIAVPYIKELTIATENLDEDKLNKIIPIMEKIISKAK